MSPDLANERAAAITAAARFVSLLDLAGSFNDGDDLELDGEEWTGDHVVRRVAGALAEVVAWHHGIGSWAASHALRTLTLHDVGTLLVAYGASQFTVQQHAKRVHGIIKSNAARGGT